jgi:hypothetical protein
MDGFRFSSLFSTILDLVSVLWLRIDVGCNAHVSEILAVFSFKVKKFLSGSRRCSAGTYVSEDCPLCSADWQPI